VTGTTGMTDAASYQTPITMRGTHHASRNHPETRPDEPYAAHPRRQDGQDHVTRAASPGQLRQAVHAAQDQQHPAREVTP
jgi:hypothetical protein